MVWRPINCGEMPTTDNRIELDQFNLSLMSSKPQNYPDNSLSMALKGAEPGWLHKASRGD